MHRKKKATTDIPLKPGKLTEYGYSASYSDRDRHAALDKVVRHEGYATAVQRVNALYVLNKNRAPKLASVYEGDVKYLKNKHS